MCGWLAPQPGRTVDFLHEKGRIWLCWKKEDGTAGAYVTTAALASPPDGYVLADGDCYARDDAASVRHIGDAVFASKAMAYAYTEVWLAVERSVWSKALLITHRHHTGRQVCWSNNVHIPGYFF